jgi:hypothetical protein
MSGLLEIFLGWALQKFLNYVDEKWQVSEVRDKVQKIVEKYNTIETMSNEKKKELAVKEVRESVGNIGKKVAGELVERAIQRFLK